MWLGTPRYGKLISRPDDTFCAGARIKVGIDILGVEYRTGESSHRKFGHELWDIAKVLFISLAIVLPIRYFLAQPFIVRGASMEPTFENNEYLIIDEASYYFQEPQRGQVIVFRYPRDPQQFFIKRIVGLPGEEVIIRNGRVHIVNANTPEGFALDEHYLHPPDRGTFPDGGRKLGLDEYFVLGDNRDFSSDSRVWGVLSKDFIIGRALLRIWPFDRFGLLSRVSLLKLS